ncbi:MAG: pyruvate kinase [Rickettsiales bacterium]|jgi:pyruvate kinase|nr:pyruvate kinase [Rickettsiales bacterium]
MIGKKTKIVSTVGFNSEKPEILKKMYAAGVNVFRLNFSHGSHEWHGKVIDNIRKLKLGAAIMLDTKGPEIRTGEVRNKLSVSVGDSFIVTINQGIYEDVGKLSVNYKGFVKDVDEGDILVFDSGVMMAKVVKKNKTDVTLKVVEGKADIVSKRHINLMGKPVNLPTVTEQDWKDIDFGIEKGVDFIALSFARSGKDVEEVREYCQKRNANIKIISKIENFEATKNLEDIIEKSDGIMVARGDLSCEIPFETVPILQKRIVSGCLFYQKPVIVATQMLLSMVDNIRPTRAEVSDVANAVYELADAVMTSEETTKGIDPVNVVNVMSRVVMAAEKDIYGSLSDLDDGDGSEADNCDCDCDCDCGCNCGCGCGNNEIMPMFPDLTDDIEAIAVISDNGSFTGAAAAKRLSLPIFSFTGDEKLAQQLNLTWNVTPIYEKNIGDDFEKNLNITDKFMKEQGFIQYLAIFDAKVRRKGEKAMASHPTIQARDLSRV